MQDIVQDVVAETMEAKKARPRVRALQSIHAKHEMAAKLVAVGMAHKDVAQYTGYSELRIKSLIHEALFADLVEKYKEQIGDVIGQDLRTQVEKLCSLIVGNLAEHIRDDKGNVSPGDLTGILTKLMDRIGYSPGGGTGNGTPLQININSIKDQNREEVVLNASAENDPPGLLAPAEEQTKAGS